MKLISAVIQPAALTDLYNALVNIGIKGVTITEASGAGRQQGHKEVYRGARYEVNFIPKMKIEIAVKDEELEKVVQTIVSTVRTGNVGDGKIWITTVDEVVRVRTGDVGEAAL